MSVAAVGAAARAERRAAAKPAVRRQEASTGRFLSTLTPSGAEPGHEQPGGLFVPGEGQGLPALRGLQGRSTYSSHEGLP